MSRRKKYRILLLCLIISGSIGLGYMGYQEIKTSLPGQMKVRSLEEQELDFGWWISEDITPETANVSVGNGASEDYQISCKLLGFLPLKNIEVKIEETQQVYTGGVPIGLYLETDGVYVIDYGTIEGEDGISYEPAKQIVQPGDYILEVDHEKINEKEILTERIGNADSGRVILTLRRGNSIFDVTVDAVKCKEGIYKAGIWVRDNTQGIGTLTFITKDRQFGALGHGINDVDTGELLTISDGTLYETNIIEISKGENGKPGEIRGTINYQDKSSYGTIQKNQMVGIYGILRNNTLLNESGKQMTETTHKQEVKKGKAIIRSAVNGTLEDYEIEILDINFKEHDLNKGIIFQVTDKRLLEYTGGIVQGMSGSPILQEGKLIGAVTHVFVQDSSKGFGIFIENMMEYVDF